MMDGIIRLLLSIGLILSIVAALTASVRIIVGYMFGTEWYWGGVVGAYAGPLAFAAALHLFDLRGKRADA